MLRALAIDPDPAVLAGVVRLLSPRGFHITARVSPDDTLDYVRRSRPNIVLLGRTYWEQGWGTRIRDASPGSVVVPSLESPDGPPSRGAA